MYMGPSTDVSKPKIDRDPVPQTAQALNSLLNLLWAELHREGKEWIENAGENNLLVGCDRWPAELQVQWKVGLVRQHLEDTQWLVEKVSGDYITHLEDIATIWQLLVSERFPIDSKQHVPNTHSIPLTEGNLGASLSVLNYIGANISKCERKCP